MKNFLLLLLLSAPLTMNLGCAADASSTDEGDLDADENALSDRARLAGAFVADSAAPFRAVAFAANGTFVADVDSGFDFACDPLQPCPDVPPIRIKGTFRATRRTLTLAPDSTAGGALQVAGRYSYAVAGETLSLHHASFSQALRRGAYCARHADLIACTADALCQPVLGPSMCASNGICTSDESFMSCEDKP